jgi:hypothetical protein
MTHIVHFYILDFNYKKVIEIIKNIINFIFVVIFITILGFGFIGTILSEKNTISEFENRQLASFPDFSFSDLSNREYFMQIEEYLNDHIINRETWLETYTKWQLLSPQLEVNGITLLDEMLLPDPPAHKLGIDIDKSVSAIEELDKETSSDVFLYFLPHKNYTLRDLYPPGYDYRNHLKDGATDLIESINQSNIPTMRLNDIWMDTYSIEELENFYFKTDHHWNTEGALLGYQLIIGDLKKHVPFPIGEALKAEDLELECYNDYEFQGTYDRQLYYLSDITESEVCRYVLEENKFDDFSNYQSGEFSSNSSYQDFYYREINLDEPIKYSHLFSNDYALTKFTNYEAPNEKNALIVKDSYSNPLIPFMSTHFNKLYVMDPRHFDNMSIYEFIEKYDIDLTLLLYNDTMLSGEFYNFSK